MHFPTLFTRRAAVVAAAVALAPLVVAEPAHASWPGANGRIAYATWRGSNSIDVRATKPDGSASAKLTTWQETDLMPGYSRDGARIAWAREYRVSQVPLVRGWELWTMRSDGADKRRVIRLDSELTCTPSWHPDGDRLLFAQTTPGGQRVFRVSVGGTGLVQLTNETADQPVSHACPQYSPDGSLIAFARTTGPRDGEQASEVRVMDPDGTNQRTVVGIAGWRQEIFSLDWHPGGDKLVLDQAGYYDRQLHGRGVIRTVNLDGTDHRQIPVANQLKPGAVWAPDGTRIAYARPGKGIFTVRPDGTDEKLLRAEMMQVSSLSWQPVVS